jgi:hypothetical protein
MKKITFLLMCFLAFACSKTEDDSNQVCTGDCTRIEGQILTKDNQPVKNAEVIFRHRHHPAPNQNEFRIIGRDKTDADGNYSMDVYLLDDELGIGSGSFELYVKKSSLPSSVFVNYDFNLWYSFMDVTTRDTVMVKNIYLPKPKTVKVNLQNFTPLAPGDKFQLQYYHPVGFERNVLNSFGNYHNYQMSTINGYNVTGNSASFDVKMADGEYNVIEIVRIKNGVYSATPQEVFIDESAPTEFTFDF